MEVRKKAWERQGIKLQEKNRKKIGRKPIWP